MKDQICSVHAFIAPELSPEEYQALSGRALLTVAHWHRRHPEFYRRLLADGTLIQRANDAASQAEIAMRALTAQGYSREKAWAMSGREWMFGANRPSGR